LWSRMAVAAAGQSSARGPGGGDGHFRRDDPPRAAQQRRDWELAVCCRRSCANPVAAEFLLSGNFRGIVVLLARSSGVLERTFSRAGRRRLGVDRQQLLSRQSALPPVGRAAGRANTTAFRR